MKKVIALRSSLTMYQNIIMVYQNPDKETYLGHSFFYDGKEGSKYLLFLYKDKLPKGKFLEAWNTLDDTSINIRIIPEPSYELAIDDFIAAWSPMELEDEIELYEVESFKDVEEAYSHNKNMGDITFYAIRKEHNDD